MKIKGTYKKNMPRLKKRMGDPIEFSPEEKVPFAVRDAMKGNHQKNFIHIVEKVIFEDLQVSPKGVVIDGGFANNFYAAKGDVKFRDHNLENDRIYPVKTQTFQIEFEDSLDELGQPDLKVTSFTTT